MAIRPECHDPIGGRAVNNMLAAAVLGRLCVGHITRVKWSRVGDSLEVDFDPEPLERIAVGDEVWIDLNPRPAPAERTAAP